LVTAESQERDGKVFLVKDCPACGTTETLISGDARRYAAKRALDGEHSYLGCGLDCLECKHRSRPTFVFCDITNRCNMNCPICINNTPSMGFLFEPPLEYFDPIFEHFAQFDPPPAMQLFGGEPTVREDMFAIIEKARSRGLPVRVVTNGLKLADEEYCRRLVATKSTILIAYDGSNPRTYERLRANKKALELKRKALDNLGKLAGAKVALMTCVAKGFNDGEIGELLDFCHHRRGYIRGVYFMPLAQTWDLSEFDLEPERITTEDIEGMLNGCFAGKRVEFVPAGVLGELPNLMQHLSIKPPPFMGAHPNCESMYILISDGREYQPLERYLRRSLPDLIRDLFAVDRKIGALARSLGASMWGRLLARLGLKERYLALRAYLAAFRAVRRNVVTRDLLRGKGLGKLWHALCLGIGVISGRRRSALLRRHTVVQESFQIIILPFEDPSTLETERLERCPNAFAFFDPRDGRVKSVPVCAWGRHKTAVLRAISEHYAGREEDARHMASAPADSGAAPGNA
jgi:hypothetical protein